MDTCDTLDAARTVRSRRRAQARLAPALLAAITRDGTVEAVAHALAGSLPATIGARRVAIGLSLGPGEPIRVRALTGQPTLDERRRAVRRLTACLEAMSVPAGATSAGDAGIRVWPDAASRDDQVVGQDVGGDDAEGAAAYAYADGCGAISLACLTLSGAHGGRLVVLFERGPGERAFASGELVGLRSALPDVAGWLVIEARRHGPWRQRARDAWRDAAGRVPVLPRMLPTVLTDAVTPRRTTALVAVCAVILLGALPVVHTVTAVATLEAEHRQVVGAAQAGHLLAVHARVGDRVEQGELLARLDDRQARDELIALREAMLRVDEELSRALAVRDRSSLGRLRAERAGVLADLSAAERRLERSRVLAPFTGTVLAGELDERLGASVQAGETLFELGADRRVRLMLEIDERDVRLVEQGLQARLRMASLPMQVWEATLEQLEPVAVAEPGRNVFRMAATLVDADESLRPGMQGVARIDTGHGALALVWTRALRERLTVLAWRIGLIG